MASLRGMSGPVRGETFQVEGDRFTIGRGADNQLCITDPSVSTHHCAVERDGDKFTLRDLDSTNGTRLNGEVIHVTRLKPKDIIQVGVVDLLFDGTNVEVEPGADAGQATRSNTGAINTVIERATNGAPVSSAFTRKRDSRRIVNTVIYLIAGLAVAALLAFVIMLLR